MNNIKNIGKQTSSTSSFVINKYSIPRGLVSNKKWVEFTEGERKYLEELKRQRYEQFSKIQMDNYKKQYIGFKGSNIKVIKMAQIMKNRIINQLSNT